MVARFNLMVSLGELGSSGSSSAGGGVGGPARSDLFSKSCEINIFANSRSSWLPRGSSESDRFIELFESLVIMLEERLDCLLWCSSGRSWKVTGVRLERFETGTLIAVEASLLATLIWDWFRKWKISLSRSGRGSSSIAFALGVGPQIPELPLRSRPMISRCDAFFLSPFFPPCFQTSRVVEPGVTTKLSSDSPFDANATYGPLDKNRTRSVVPHLTCNGLSWKPLSVGRRHCHPSFVLWTWTCSSTL